MLFNFQGPQPNLARLAAPLGTAYLLYHVAQILSSTFFQSFFDSFKCQIFRSSMMENCVFGFVKPFLRFPPLPSRGQLIYITTPVPVCQHLFSTFFVFFFRGITSPLLCEKSPYFSQRNKKKKLDTPLPFGVQYLLIKLVWKEGPPCPSIFPTTSPRGSASRRKTSLLCPKPARPHRTSARCAF